MSANQVIVSESKTIVSVNETTNEVTIIQAAPNQVNVQLTTQTGGASSVAWGDITGTLSSQTDLQLELDGKEFVSNKVSDFSTINNDLYPTTQAVDDRINSAISAGSTFIFSSINSDISGYESMQLLSDFTVTGAASASNTVTTSPTLIEEFATDSGQPNLTVIAAGVYFCHYETLKNAGSNNYLTFFELYKRTAGGTETLLLTSDNSSYSALNTWQQQTLSAYSSTNITLNATDRLVVKIYAQMASSSATISIRYDYNTNARLSLPTSPLGYVPENVANKSTDVALGTSDTLYPSQAAVKSYVDTGLATKEPTITTLPISKGGTNSGTALSNNRVMKSSGGKIIEAAAITASRALVSDANGIPTHATTTTTELNYVSGVTSAIQTQLASKATTQQTDFISGYIETAVDGTIIAVIKIPYAITITSITTKCVAGSCTLTGQIDGVNLGGTANAVSTTEREETHSSANSASVGNDIQVRISSNAGCTGLSFTIKFTRSLS